MAISIHLYQTLKRLNITQKELVENTKIPKNTISAYCNNASKMITISHLDKICNYLNCNLNDIVRFTPEEEFKKGKNNRYHPNYYEDKSVSSNVVDEINKEAVINGLVSNPQISPFISSTKQELLKFGDEQLTKDFENIIFKYLSRVYKDDE